MKDLVQLVFRAWFRGLQSAAWRAFEYLSVQLSDAIDRESNNAIGIICFDIELIKHL